MGCAFYYVANHARSFSQRLAIAVCRNKSHAKPLGTETWVSSSIVALWFTSPILRSYGSVGNSRKTDGALKEGL